MLLLLLLLFQLLYLSLQPCQLPLLSSQLLLLLLHPLLCTCKLLTKTHSQGTPTAAAASAAASAVLECSLPGGCCAVRISLRGNTPARQGT